MNQVIHETKIKLSNSSVDLSTDRLIHSPLITTMSILNNFSDLINGLQAIPLSNQSFISLGNLNNSYSVVEFYSLDMFYLSFEIDNVEFNFKTSQFTYRNNINKLSNIKIANGTLHKINNTTFTEVENSKFISVKYLLIGDYNTNIDSLLKY
jgi:hypothetical protein